MNKFHPYIFMKIYVDDYKKSDDLIDTNAINIAISKANKGDTIVFGNRIYRSGTIRLKDDINIFLKNDTVLKASDNIDDFKDGSIFNDKLDVNTFVNCDYDGLPKLYFIYGKDINNVKIYGKGKIDGNENIFHGEETEYYIEGKFYPRMPLIYIENGKNLIFKNITLTNSAFWTLHLVGCDNVDVYGIKVLNNRRMLNADGIDPDHSKNIKITNSYIESADDCIAIKNTEYFGKYGDSYNIYVNNCIFKSTSAALKIGTETCGNFYNIKFNNIKILDSNRAISLQLRDSGNIKDVYFNNIDIETHMFYPKAFWGKGEAISITAIRRNENTNLGNINNIHFNNINAKSEHGIFLYNVNDIDFNNVNINCVNNTEYDKNIYDLRPNEDLKIINDDVKVIYALKSNNIIFNKFSHNNLYELLNNDNDSHISFD